ncbi:MAG: hypothetical protein GXO65_03235, partial [Euryarchaeota archaeon]|nr:hypothetical protein [Euryarchaeota archaeon]
DALRADIKEEFRELARLYKQQGLSIRVSKLIDASYRVIDALDRRLDRFQEQGEDVTVEKAKLKEIRAMVDLTKEKLDEGDVDGAIEELKDAREAFTHLVREVKRSHQVKTLTLAQKEVRSR